MRMPYRVRVTGVIRRFSLWDGEPVGVTEVDQILGPYRVRTKCELEIARDRKERARMDRDLGWESELEYEIQKGREEVVTTVTEIWEVEDSS